MKYCIVGGIFFGFFGFFLTSEGSGRGGDLGGLAGADAHCQTLAQAVGAGGKTWRAYLSSSSETEPVHARERIGIGPWYNAAGIMISNNLEQLHSPSNNLRKETVLDENGEIVSGGGDDVNRHDILTVSFPTCLSPPLRKRVRGPMQKDHFLKASASS